MFWFWFCLFLEKEVFKLLWVCLWETVIQDAGVK